MANRACIRVVGARQHNLKGIDIEIPRAALTVITGPSGSGKSSLAFDTIFAEGRRRYMESLSTYARQFLEQVQRPDVDRVEGLPPTLGIEQRNAASSPRSTVATSADIHDFLRVLFARVGQPRCWKCNRAIVKQSVAQIVDAILAGCEGRRMLLLAPLVESRRGAHKKLLEGVVKEGFVRARIDGSVVTLDAIPSLSPRANHTIEVVVDRLSIKPDIATRLADSIEVAVAQSGGRLLVATESAPGEWSDEAYSTVLSCPEHADVRIDTLGPQLFSFNSPQGACERCTGLGRTSEFDVELIVPNPDLSLNDGAIAAWRRQGKHLNAVYTQLVSEFCKQFDLLPDMAFRNIPEPIARILLAGTTKADVEQHGAAFEGVIPNLKRRWETAETESGRQRLRQFLSDGPCDDCGGGRLCRAALCVTVEGSNLANITAMTVTEAVAFFDQLSFSGEDKKVAAPLLREIRQRLGFLVDVGVDYLTLDRASSTLSGGEWQRIRLATQIGSELAGVCYVLDEPTIGLHARDTQRLVNVLHRLADLDNTVLVVEHDPQVIAAAAHVIDIGPGAGAAGGYLMAQGSYDTVLKCPDSLTAQFLTGRSRISLPENRRSLDWAYALELRGVTANNLKGVNVRFPLGCLICVTGVSGSGKSTLIRQVLLPSLRRVIDRRGPKPGPCEQVIGAAHVDRVIEINQTPIGRSPRSNPATYVGVFDLIRQLYAKTRQAKIRGYAAARFSFNIKGGRCEACEGQGVKKVAMHFLPDVYVTCGQCGGTRYNRETMDIRYRGKNIGEVLAMAVDDAVLFFESFSNIHARLQALKDVGLGYMTLGQSSSTLSGGEAQRVKLASELHHAAPGHTLFVLDEPTSGLHFGDVRNLLRMLNRLTDRGQTVIVIEHHMDVIKTADWVIDLGPEGGDGGGYVVATGRPEDIAQCSESYTGKYLAEKLAEDAKAQSPTGVAED